MKELNKVWETKYWIRFSDCDPFSHLNNSRYLDYFINAREDHLLQFHHFNVYDTIRENGLGWVIGKNEIIYVRPALMMEMVTIQSSILKIDDRMILVEMSMWDEQKANLKALLWITFIHYNLKAQKAEKHSAEFLQLFQPYENPLPEPLGIDERVKALRKSFR